MDLGAICSTRRFNRFCWDLFSIWLLVYFCILSKHLSLKGTRLRH